MFAATFSYGQGSRKAPSTEQWLGKSRGLPDGVRRRPRKRMVTSPDRGGVKKPGRARTGLGRM